MTAPKLPEMHPCTSSNIEAVGHCGEALWIRFKGGGVYQYPGVTAEHAEAIRTADSPGSHFHRVVKSGGFAHKKFEGAT